MNLLEYLGTEETNFLVSFNDLRGEFAIFNRVDGMYQAAFSNIIISKGDDIIPCQLLALVHFHYYHSTATLLRCHLSESLSSMRVAIEAGLSAYRIIEDRPSQLNYVNRHRSFFNLKPFYERERRKDPSAFPLAEPLLKLRDACSQYGAHADIGTFVHRLELPEVPGDKLKLQYFQHPKNRWDFRWWFLRLIHTYLTTLLVFEKFVVEEKGAVKADWAKVLRQTGGNLEKLMAEVKVKGAAADEAG